MRKYFLVWLSSLGDVEELCYNEFLRYVYNDYYEDKRLGFSMGSKGMRKEVEKNDVGNGLISYVSDEWIIIEDNFVD